MLTATDPQTLASNDGERRGSDRLERWATKAAAPSSRVDIWRIIQGARSLCAVALIGTLLMNRPSTLFAAATDHPRFGPRCGGAAALGIFCHAQSHLRGLQIVAALALVVCATGWRPRLTGLIQAYLTLSFVLNIALPDGGDSVAANLAVLMVPLCMLDGRRWGFGRTPGIHAGGGSTWRGALLTAALLAVRSQVSFIYLDAGLSKLGVRDWQAGTAMYYIAHNNLVPVGTVGAAILRALVRTTGGVTLLTWGTIVLECALGAAFMLRSDGARRLAFLFGASFHVAIGLVLGLHSFALVMIGALFIYLQPPLPSLNSLRTRRGRPSSESLDRSGRGQMQRPTTN